MSNESSGATGTDARKRKVSTDPSGRDLPSQQHVNDRQRGEALATQRRKDVGDAKRVRDMRRYEWGSRLERRMLRLEVEIEEQYAWRY